ncbi:UNVERIFIED_CONTAM: hypothetical protein Sradi_1310200 [Sesamum radiatum]|uniref:DUF8040 domain-containing protein n=1 Tax=Sesamum radiatum TaxID=300843 RepID=A0AAW2URE4_SESRA
MNSRISNQVRHLHRLVSILDELCSRNLCLDRNAFGWLRYLLEYSRGLLSTKHLTVSKQVAIFFSVVAHHKKNCGVKHDFIRFDRTISKYFHRMLNAIVKLYNIFLVRPTLITDDCMDSQWRWFKGCLDGLDRTFIDVRVPKHEKGRYQTRKGGLRVPAGHYNLCDNGYANEEGFLTPYRGVCYHLREWDRGFRGPQNHQELFNLKHSSVHLTKEVVSRLPTKMDLRTDEGSSRQRRRGGNTERPFNRQTLMIKEDECLLAGLKSLVVTGWKCDNGFRNGLSSAIGGSYGSEFSTL